MTPSAIASTCSISSPSARTMVTKTHPPSDRDVDFAHTSAAASPVTTMSSAIARELPVGVVAGPSQQRERFVLGDEASGHDDPDGLTDHSGRAQCGLQLLDLVLSKHTRLMQFQDHLTVDVDVRFEIIDPETVLRRERLDGVDPAGRCHLAGVAGVGSGVGAVLAGVTGVGAVPGNLFARIAGIGAAAGGVGAVPEHLQVAADGGQLLTEHVDLLLHPRRGVGLVRIHALIMLSSTSTRRAIPAQYRTGVEGR